MEISRKYAIAAVILFPLIDRGTLDFESTPVTFSAGDCQIMKNEQSFANTASLPSYRGNGTYSLNLTASEMAARRIVITVIDAATKAWEDQAILVTTYGSGSAEHGFDLDVAVPLVALAAQGKLDVNAEADTALADYDGPTKAEMDTAHALLSTLAAQTTIDTVVDAIKAVTDNLPDSGALNDLAAILVDTMTTLQGELDGIQADTENIQSRLPAALVGGRMDASVGAMVAAVLTAAAIATNAITATKIAANALTSSEIADSFVNKIADGIFSRDLDFAEGSAPLHSMLTALLAAVSKVEDDGAGNIKIYRTDGVTLHATRALTADASLDPIKTLGGVT